jgi:hypothetical protein
MLYGEVADSQHSWNVHCVGEYAEPKKYAYCAHPYGYVPPATTATTTAPADPSIIKIDIPTTPANHDDEESRYSWEVHCATAEGRAKYAYCQNPEPAALQVLYGLVADSQHSWNVHCKGKYAEPKKYAYCAHPYGWKPKTAKLVLLI